MIPRSPELDAALHNGQRAGIDEVRLAIRHEIDVYERCRARFGSYTAWTGWEANQRGRILRDLAELRKIAVWLRKQGLDPKDTLGFGPPVIRNKPPHDYDGRRRRRVGAALASIAASRGAQPCQAER
jgi:hypothetical protein